MTPNGNASPLSRPAVGLETRTGAIEPSTLSVAVGGVKLRLLDVSSGLGDV